MTSLKRIIIATVMGAICGVICCLLASSSGELPWFMMASIFTSRLLIGFFIGISALGMHWAIHGPLMGLILSVPGGLAAMMGGNPNMTGTQLLIGTIVMGVIYGFLIELVTSVFFKARQKRV